MAVNKVEVNGETKLDLTQDTVTPENLLSGATAHNAAGEPISGAVAVAEASTTTPKAPGKAAVGTETKYARGDHVHPKEVSDDDRAAWDGKAAGKHASQHGKDGTDPITPTAIGAVGYDAAQSLTDTQKNQARSNIAAAATGFGFDAMIDSGTLNTDDAFKSWFEANILPKTYRKPVTASVYIPYFCNYRTQMVAFSNYGALQGGVMMLFKALDGRAFVRQVHEDTSWGEFEYIDPPMQLGVEYRTTERYQGKPVYAQLMNFGHAPAQGSMKTVATPSNSENQQLVWAMLTYYGIVFPKYKSDGTSSMWIYVAASSSQFQIYSPGEDRSANGDIYALVKYTKKTD